jgi:hypothetical protein
MSTPDYERALRSANPVGRERLDRLDFEAMEADLLADIDGEGSAFLEVAPPRVRRHRSRRLVVAVGTAAVAVAMAAFVIFAGGSAEHPSRAYGADLVRFAESSPLLLLEGPGWRVQNVEETRSREGVDGSMEFVTGKPIPYQSITITGNDEEGQHESGMQPAAERQRRVSLEWRHASLAEAIAYQRSPKRVHPHGRHFVRLPVLGTTAFVDTHAEVFVNQGGPGDREMIALWSEDGYLLELQAAVPSLAAFEERLGWLTKVDQETWLEAMPAKVVKASQHDAVVREVLRGIPTPKTFTPARVPDEGLNTDRYQVGAQATGTVACLWFRQWGEGVRTGDEAAVEEAVKAMSTAKHWPILREMTKEGDWSYVLWEDAKWMPKGYFEYAGHKRDLLAHAEGLGCARKGIPLTPKKMAIARERGGPPPPPR